MSGVLLAAGPSRRFAGGLPKQLAPVGGEPMVRRAARAALASRLAEVVVVLGHRGPEVRRALAGLDLRWAENPAWEAGQSGSVRAGLAAVDDASGAALFLPCDQPFLTAGVLDCLIAAWRAGGASIVVPAFEGRRGAPVLFDRRLFGELETITGDEGGRQLFARHPTAIREVELDRPEPLLDVDDRAAWEQLSPE